jgi:hypothetical protein
MGVMGMVDRPEYFRTFYRHAYPSNLFGSFPVGYTMLW